MVDLNDAPNGEFPGDFHYTLGVLKGYSEQPRLSKRTPTVYRARPVLCRSHRHRHSGQEDCLRRRCGGVCLGSDRKAEGLPLYPTMGWYRSRGGVHLVWELPDTSLPRWLEIHAQVREHLGALGIQYDDLGLGTLLPSSARDAGRGSAAAAEGPVASWGAARRGAGSGGVPG